jgi:hypothetical protein
MPTVELDVETHTYFIDGKKFEDAYPSRVLKDLQLCRNYGWIDPYYAERGRCVHIGCDILNKGKEVDPASLEQDVASFVAAYKNFLKTSGFKPIASELSLYSTLHNFACTLDVVGELEGEMTLIDLKTSKSLDPAVEIQLGAQYIAWEENHVKQPIARRMALSLRQDGTYALKDCSHVSPYLWLDALKLWRWRRTHKR